MGIQIIQGSDKDLIVRLKSASSGDPFDLTGVSLIEACFESDPVVTKRLVNFKGDTDGVTDLITNIADTALIPEGAEVSGPGVPTGSTVLKTPTSSISPTPAGTVQISQITTSVNVQATFSTGDIDILGSPLLGKINIHLNEADTAALEEGEGLSFEVKVVKDGFTSLVQFPESIDVLEGICG